MNTNLFFDGKNLNDAAIMKMLHYASECYEDGAIIETMMACRAIARAIQNFCKVEEKQ